MKRLLFIGYLYFSAVVAAYCCWIQFGLTSRVQQVIAGQADAHKISLLLVLLLMPFLFLAAGVRETRRYVRWRRGIYDSEHIENELAQAAGHKWWFPFKPRLIYAECRTLYYELRVIIRRARRRWPARKRELRSHLLRSWTRGERIGLGILVGGEILGIYLTWAITDLQSVAITVRSCLS